MPRIVKRRPRQSEPTLPLINIVFLMLVFFLVAAQVARPIDADLNLVRTDDPNLVPPADVLVVHKDGRLTWRGSLAEPKIVYEALVAEGYVGPARILPDRDASAMALMDVVRGIQRDTDFDKIVIVTERALQ
jgi:biopolymer transport protein ExbD